MRKFAFVVATAVLLVGSVAAVQAASHPDSKTQSIADGCNRTQLGLLGEAGLTMLAPPRPTPFPSWVYVNGDNRPKTLEGTVLGTHTAGTDLFGVHDTYDANFDVVPDAAFEGLLSTRNAAEKPGQIHTEWESGLAPLFAWPSTGDRVRETGSEIWDCGHWQEGARKVPSSDLLPGDPLGEAGVEKIGGEDIEIHPISELATWRANGDFTPRGKKTPVRASRLDVALSNQGGKAKGVEECALTVPTGDSTFAGRLVEGGGCSTLQDITGRNYVYTLRAPGPRPSPTSVLRVQQRLRYGHHSPNASMVSIRIRRDAAQITVPFKNVPRSADVQDFGATWQAWWSHDPAPTHRFSVTLQSVAINNNLDGDSGDTNGNPSITPEGEWNMFVDVAGQWINLHDTGVGRVDYVPQLGAVPSAKPTPQVFSLNKAPRQDVVLGDGDRLHLFTDARECDQPGYVDCPTKNEIASTGRSAGRTELSLPVNQLVGRSTTITIHPPLCTPGGGCPEDRNPPSLCPNGCYSVTYRVDDVSSSRPRAAATVVGDGTKANTSYAGQPAGALSWWIEPITRYGPDQGEENLVVARVIQELGRRQQQL